MDFMELFDVIIVAFGVYVIYTAIRMKKTGEISTIVVNKDDISKCKDKNGFIQYIYLKTQVFGIVATLFGLFGLFNDMIYSFGMIVNWVGIGIFLVMWVWFTQVLRKGREMFF